MQTFGLVQQGIQYFLIPGSQCVGRRSDLQLTVFGHGEAHWLIGQARPFVLQVFFEIGVNLFHFTELYPCLDFFTEEEPVSGPLHSKIKSTIVGASIVRLQKRLHLFQVFERVTFLFSTTHDFVDEKPPPLLIYYRAFNFLGLSRFCVRF
ncbi:hypothetical protein D3C87_1305260 [compost metagenome]